MILVDVVTGKIYEVSVHAQDKMEADGITEDQIFDALHHIDSRTWSDIHESWIYTEPRIRKPVVVAVNEEVFPMKITTVYYIRKVTTHTYHR